MSGGLQAGQKTGHGSLARNRVLDEVPTGETAVPACNSAVAPSRAGTRFPFLHPLPIGRASPDCFLDLPLPSGRDADQDVVETAFKPAEDMLEQDPALNGQQGLVPCFAAST